MKDGRHKFANIGLDLHVRGQVCRICVRPDNIAIPLRCGDEFLRCFHGLNGRIDVERGCEVRGVDGWVGEGGTAGELDRTTCLPSTQVHRIRMDRPTGGG